MVDSVDVSSTTSRRISPSRNPIADSLGTGVRAQETHE